MFYFNTVYYKLCQQLFNFIIGKKLQPNWTQNLYISTLFKKLEISKSLKPDKIYVLSAEYGLNQRLALW